MTTHSETETPSPGKDAGVDELEADIERTRENLGRTVEELSEKFDVKSRARHKMKDVKQRATNEQGKIKLAIPVAAATVVAGIAVVVWRKKR